MWALGSIISTAKPKLKIHTGNLIMRKHQASPNRGAFYITALSFSKGSQRPRMTKGLFQGRDIKVMAAES